MNTTPFQQVTIYEIGTSLTSRLLGLLYADQGADVFILPTDDDNDYLNRNKQILKSNVFDNLSSADILIIDGEDEIQSNTDQIVIRIFAALPGDEFYDYLPHNCDDDLLNSLVGFYTDMAITGKLLGRDSIYTPIPLCSIYSAVLGANASAAALIERLQTGRGREISLSRLACGLSAIGALALKSTGLDEHLSPPDFSNLSGSSAQEDKTQMIDDLRNHPGDQLMFEQDLIPMGSPYICADGQYILHITAVNRRLAMRLCQHLNIWDKLTEIGIVDVNPYDPDQFHYAHCNIADSMALEPAYKKQLAYLLRQTFQTKSAKQWYKELSEIGLPVEIIQHFQNWFHSDEAKNSGIVAQLINTQDWQLGRVAWIDSAKPYPKLKLAKLHEALQTNNCQDTLVQKEPKPAPLNGVTVLDLTNVIAGPSCARMLAELGATVYRIEPPNPQHTPLIMTTWAAELGVGKQSMIVDINQQLGRQVLNDLIAKADLIVLNKLDAQIEKMGLSREQLNKINPKIICVQVSAKAGEIDTPSRHHHGYDPSIQGVTGIMTRFGREGCPSFHGLASCVDYLCGYLGVWAGLVALYAREKRGNDIGDHAQTSLACAASLTQFLFQQHEPPKTAIGPEAIGPNNSQRIYPVRNGFLFAQAYEDLSSQLKDLKLDEALIFLKKKNILAVPVQSVSQLAAKHRTSPCNTVRFVSRNRDGWQSECFEPTWFIFDGKMLPHLTPASRPGSDSIEILRQLGYSDESIKTLIDDQVIGPVEWNKYKPLKIS